MSFENTDVTNHWKYLNFINFENASVIVVARKSHKHQDLLSVWVTEVQVLGRSFGAWKSG